MDELLEAMAEIMSILKSIGALPVEWRHLIFFLWLLARVFIAYGTPYFVLKEKGAEASKQPYPGVQQNITISVPETSKEQSFRPKTPVAISTTSVNRENAGALTEKVDVSIVPASNVIAPRTIAGGITIHVSGGTNIIQLAGDLSFTERDYNLTNDTGGELKIKIYLLFNSAAWSTGSSSKLITHKNKEVILDDFLESKKFILELERFQAVVCLGLASGQGNAARNLRLTDERAVHLCGRVSRAVEAIKRDIPVYGLPLGYNRNERVNERAQRSVVLLGVQLASGTLTNEAEQRRVITCALKEDIVDDFKFSDYSEVMPGKLFRYNKINRGTYTQNCREG